MFKCTHIIYHAVSVFVSFLIPEMSNMYYEDVHTFSYFFSLSTDQPWPLNNFCEISPLVCFLLTLLRQKISLWHLEWGCYVIQYEINWYPNYKSHFVQKFSKYNEFESKISGWWCEKYELHFDIKMYTTYVLARGIKLFAFSAGERSCMWQWGWGGYENAQEFFFFQIALPIIIYFLLNFLKYSKFEPEILKYYEKNMGFHLTSKYTSSGWALGDQAAEGMPPIKVL